MVIAWLRLATYASLGIALAVSVNAARRIADSGEPQTAGPPVHSSESAGRAGFLANLPKGFQVPTASDEVGLRVLAYDGAYLVARDGVALPPTPMFASEDATSRWQASVKTAREPLGATSIELQEPAMRALLEARTAAAAVGADITPRGMDPARRDYADTVKWWKSRVGPGLEHWVAEGRLDRVEARRITALAAADQTREIFHLEDRGLYFSPNFKQTILSSVTPPGASQHIAMLAIDIEQYQNATVRSILARHGWFQTVLRDLPHFTYLGVPESQLSSLGLKTVTIDKRTYWVPDLGAAP